MRVPTRRGPTTSKPGRKDDRVTDIALSVIMNHGDEIERMVRRCERESLSQYELATEVENELRAYLVNAFGDAFRLLVDTPSTRGMQSFIPMTDGIDHDRLVSEVMREFGRKPLSGSTMDLYFDMGGKTFRLVVPDMGGIAASIEEYDRVNGTEFVYDVDGEAWYKAGRRAPANAVTIHRMEDAYDAIRAVRRPRTKPGRPVGKLGGMGR